jgi:hypothetical protein
LSAICRLADSAFGRYAEALKEQGPKIQALGLFEKWMSMKINRHPTIEELRDPTLMISAILSKLEELPRQLAAKPTASPQAKMAEADLPADLVPGMYVYVQLTEELNMRLWGGIITPDGLYGEAEGADVWVRMRVEEVEKRAAGNWVRISYGSLIAVALISSEQVAMVRPDGEYRELHGWSRRDDVDALLNASTRYQSRAKESKREDKKVRVDAWPAKPSQERDLELVCFTSAIVQAFKAFDTRHAMEGRGDPVGQFFELMFDQYRPKDAAGRQDPRQRTFEAGLMLHLERTRQTGGTVGEFVCRVLQPLQSYPTAAEFEATLGAHHQEPDEQYQVYYNRLGLLLNTFPTAVRVGQDARYVERALNGLRSVTVRDLAVKERALQKFRDMVRDRKTIHWRSFLDVMKKTCEEVPKGLDRLSPQDRATARSSRPAAVHRVAAPANMARARWSEEEEEEDPFQLQIAAATEQDF